MGLKQKRMIRKAIRRINPDAKVLGCPAIECPVLDCNADVVDLDLLEETETQATWHGICRICDNHFTLTMPKD